ncbi:MAG: GNAT family N-acetyltransferase [Bacteroidetes bacterium]|jgi:predicted GNAT family N-acyltransferase|nr:GNAT family N-acetyltransferase [Bacteroidota bacterium]
MGETPNIEFEFVDWGSVKYVQSLALRHEVLRKPLGLVFDASIFPEERGDIHLVANHGDWLVGCMILTETGKDLKMRQVAVANKYRRCKVGARMVAMAEAKAIDLGKQKMILHARDTAMEFYLSLGYSIVGDSFEEVGIPHHRMEKSFV